MAFAWDGEQGGSFDIYIKLVDAGTPLRLTTNPANEYGPTCRRTAAISHSVGTWESAWRFG